MRSFNENAFGLVGLATIIWGGFKILIGVFIYSVALWALFFRQESFGDLKLKKAIDGVLKKVDNDLRLNNLGVAKDRLHALVWKYPNNLRIKFETAKLYLLENDLINAGRYLYLKPNPNKKEQECIRAFEESLGDNPFQILRRLSKPSKINKDFVGDSKRRIKRLLKGIKSESEKRSWIVREYAYYLDELSIPLYKRTWKEERDIIIHLIILLILFGLSQILPRT